MYSTRTDLTIERNGEMRSIPPQGTLPSKKGKVAAVSVLVISATATVLGTLAVIAFFISPHSNALKWIDIGPYSFVLLGGGILMTTISSLVCHRLNKQEKRYLAAIPMATQASWGRTIAYDREGDKEACNLDVSYANPTKGYGIVLDGVGHNAPQRGPGISNTFDQFIDAYRPITRASSLEEARIAIMNQLTPFTNETKFPSVGGAAVSFCQIVEIEGIKNLLLFQWADTRVLIQRSDGNIDWLDGFYTNDIDQAGFGFGYKFGSFLIEEGSTIIGFSDGIGEYMSKEMFTQALNQENEEPLLNRLVEGIRTNESHLQETPITGSALKSHQRKGGDDVSLFCLKV